MNSVGKLPAEALPASSGKQGGGPPAGMDTAPVLETFARKEPFHRVHECVFALLALENEAADPRL
jgi:hypothetical protein